VRRNLNPDRDERQSLWRIAQSAVQGRNRSFMYDKYDIFFARFGTVIDPLHPLHESPARSPSSGRHHFHHRGSMIHIKGGLAPPTSAKTWSRGTHSCPTPGFPICSTSRSRILIWRPCVMLNEAEIQYLFQLPTRAWLLGKELVEHE
jgi:hypothetical protein